MRPTMIMYTPVAYLKRDFVRKREILKQRIPAIYFTLLSPLIIRQAFPVKLILR